jgi:tRNA threonylcarbamoyladenosine modification (KEOPS) complex  Pcc1 subunit
MSDDDPGWTAVLTVRLHDERRLTWLEQALAPEVAREVPRARAELARAAPDALEVRLTARDTGAVRAAMNTYLGWISLALATVTAARTDAPARSP